MGDLIPFPPGASEARGTDVFASVEIVICRDPSGEIRTASTWSFDEVAEAEVLAAGLIALERTHAKVAERLAQLSEQRATPAEVVEAGPTPHDAARLAILRRVLTGPATTADLVDVAGSHAPARAWELRNMALIHFADHEHRLGPREASDNPLAYSIAVNRIRALVADADRLGSLGAALSASAWFRR